ncbi:kremen protein 1-like [Saccostrea cucullata]|uniref:kremen protein 1-like n=1 Tax=Saccostrea cuccullata TaxID=36930 RepID=UPI002ECFD4B8
MKIVAVFLILETVCFLSSEAIPGYLGCVKAHINRFLTGKAIKSGDMTINKCNSMCMKHNYKFYGVQAGQWCFCGNTFQKTFRRPWRECNMRCAGNRRQPCGGHMRMNLFLNKGYLGCFQDQKDRVLTGKYKQDGMMTIPKCRDWCAKDKKQVLWSRGWRMVLLWKHSYKTCSKTRERMQQEMSWE